MKDITTDKTLGAFLRRHIGGLAFLMMSSVATAIGVVSVIPDLWFFEQAGLNATQHESLRSTDAALDSRLTSEEIIIGAHVQEYEDLADMIQGSFTLIQEQISDVALTTELTRRYDSLVQRRTAMRTTQIRLDRIISLSSAREKDFEDFAQVTADIETIGVEMREIERLQGL